MEVGYVFGQRAYLERKEREREKVRLLEEKKGLLKALEASGDKSEEVLRLAAETRGAILEARRDLPRGNLQVYLFLGTLLTAYVLLQAALIPIHFEQVKPFLGGSYIQTFRSRSVPWAELGYFLTKNPAVALLLTFAYLALIYVLQASVRMSRAKWISLGLSALYAGFWAYLMVCVQHLGFRPLI